MGPFLELVAVDIRRRLTQPPAPAAFSEAELDGQVLAPHQGFHWSARVAGVIGGFDQCLDGRGQLRWKLLGLVPVMRADGPDVARSAVGRAAGEAMWLPTTLLPRFGVEWEAPDDHHITARLSLDGSRVNLDYALAEDGRIRSVVFDRWGDPDRSGA